MASNSTTVLNIPLPSGWTEAYYFQYHVSLLQISLISAIAFSVVLWDHMVLLPEELLLWQKKDSLNAATSWAFLILRYGAIVATFPSLFYTSISSGTCQFSTSLSQVGTALVTGASGVIFGARVIGLWSHHKIVKMSVGLAFVFMMSCWIAAATQYQSTNGPPQPVFTNCQARLVMPDWVIISSVSAVIFDLVIIAFTTLKTYAGANNSGSCAFDMYRDSFFYFILVLATNIMVMAIQALKNTPSNDFLKPMVLPFYIIVTTTVGSRVFFDIHKFEQRQRTKRMINNYSQAVPADERDATHHLVRAPSDTSQHQSSQHGQTVLPNYSVISNKSLPTYSFAVPTMSFPSTVTEDEEQERVSTRERYGQDNKLPISQSPTSKSPTTHRSPTDDEASTNYQPSMNFETSTNCPSSMSSHPSSSRPSPFNDQPPPPPMGPRPYPGSVRQSAATATSSATPRISMQSNELSQGRSPI